MRAFILPADCASRLTNFWADHQVTILRLVLAVMLLGTVYRLGTEFYRLILDPGPAGAIDLRLRYEEVHEWFAGNPVYGVLPKADYPPASYLMLWPLLGWLSVASARWLWAITSLLILVWLVRFLVRESRMETSLERATVALLPLSIHGTGGTIGNGQLILHILPAILGALLILDRTDRGWSEDLLASALFLLSLVKLNVAAPFFWLVILIGGLRPALIILGGYVSLTFFSAWFQPEGALSLFGQFMDRAATKESGYANIYNWLVRSGLESWILPVSLIVLMVLGLLAFRLRHAGYWFLVGITAIVARLWTYHRPYDDFLILLPMIALLRLARFSPTESGRAMAGVLLAATWVGMLAPAHYLLFPRTAVSVIFETLQAGVWIAALVFLVVEGMRQESSIDLTATRVPLSTGA